MLTLTDCLQPRENDVAAKVIDGEAIIINLANGIYYSMDKVGALIWDLIQGGHNLAHMIVLVTERYEVSRERAEADIEELANELLRENLVTLSEEGSRAAETRQLERQEKLPYEVPKLNIYRDMGDLLALDPPVPGLGDSPWKEPDIEPSK
jgi:hypothetical protein